MMKAFQFWLLIFGSIIVSVLLLQTVYLNRELDRQQRVLIDSQETAATATVFENAWKQLAIKVYETGHQDPEMVALLKSESVNINIGNPPEKAPGPNPVGPGAPKLPVVPQAIVRPPGT